MADPDVETFHIPGGVAPQGFASESGEEDIWSELFYMSALIKGGLYIIFTLKQPIYLIIKRAKMWLY